MNTIEVERRANELADRFIVGNRIVRTFVARDIVTEDAPVAASLAAHVLYYLEEDDNNLAVTFLDSLERERYTVEGWK